MDKKNGNPFGGNRKDSKPVWISLDLLNNGTAGTTGASGATGAATGATGASGATGAATGSTGDTGADSGTAAVTAGSDFSGTSGFACKIPLEVIPSQYGMLLAVYFANALTAGLNATQENILAGFLTAVADLIAYKAARDELDEDN